ncbi:MAG TPA: TIGR03085 family metal-binding protein [Acidimicrobiales bacterium]|nr:TIGR03085 family metal-binding protein [Acidimicrobiales bacterium]
MTRSGPPFCQRERSALCDLLAELGPDVPTLCAGWTSADLAAHLYVRDRRLDTGPGNVVKWPPFGGWTKRVQDNARDTLKWGALLKGIRSGPPAAVKPFDRALNTIEYYVHHEDVRRAQPEWAPRVLAPKDDEALWHHISSMRFGYLFSSQVLRRAPAAARLEAPGREPILLTKNGQGTVVRGPVGEVTLWLLGRKEVAQVDVASE